MFSNNRSVCWTHYNGTRHSGFLHSRFWFRRQRQYQNIFIVPVNCLDRYRRRDRLGFIRQTNLMIIHVGRAFWGWRCGYCRNLYYVNYIRLIARYWDWQRGGSSVRWSRFRRKGSISVSRRRRVVRGGDGVVYRDNTRWWQRW